MRNLFKYPLFFGLWVTDVIIRQLTRSVRTHRLLLGPGIEPLRWWAGRMRAWRTFHKAARSVPAYAQHLASVGAKPTLPSGPIAKAIAAIPEMDKASYIKQYSILDRSLDGKLPRRGVVVDESSGSSGIPISWVRGPEERLATRQLLQMGFWRTEREFPDRQPFVLNCFSLGAWATGMNVSASLTEITMIKSIGPDRDKVIQTMREFGPRFTYVITGYPPFLKALFEDDRLDWSQYEVLTAFGGEGISENMRGLILEHARAAYGSYGASDLEINIAIETDFSIAVRQAIAASPELSAELTRQREYGVLPMVFQFNPFDYLMETNEAGELLVTITRATNINPRIRYNIHDRGHVLRLRDLKPVLRAHGLGSILDEAITDLPLLFLYGRSDMSVDFNGAVVAPDSVRDVLFANPDIADLVENHRLISYEDSHGDRQLHLAFQLVEGAAPGALDETAVGTHVFESLRRANGDFSNAIRTAPSGTLPSFALYPFRTGPFAEDGKKLKNEYVWILGVGEIEAWQLRPGYEPPRNL